MSIICLVMWWILGVMLVNMGLGINIPLSPGQQSCFNVIGGKEYKVEYVISGVEEANTVFRVIHGNDILLSH